MKRRLSTSETIFIWLLTLLLVAVAFMTPENSLNVHAKKLDTNTDLKEENVTDGAKHEPKEGNETLSGNDIPKEEATCICVLFFQESSVNEICEVCKKEYLKCAYAVSNVKISIETPEGWNSGSTKMEDLMDSGNYNIQSVQAKISQNGSWMDIMEEKKVEIPSDNPEAEHLKENGEDEDEEFMEEEDVEDEEFLEES